MGVNRFKLARLEKGLRQIDVARAAGIGEGYVSRIETGRVTPATALLRRIAQALNVAPNYFGTDPMLGAKNLTGARTGEIELQISRGAVNEMTEAAALRSLALMARWALRKAQKRRQGAEEEVSEVVTGPVSKGSGSQEATQLTCYGPPKR